MKNIPQLYETEQTAASDKIIYQKYEIRTIGFYWLIAELDRKTNTAFGYANLHDDFNAEWGYISIEELLDNGAQLIQDWKPCKFSEAMKMNQENMANEIRYAEGQCEMCEQHANIRIPVAGSGASVSYLCISCIEERQIAVLLEYVEKFDIKTEAL